MQLYAEPTELTAQVSALLAAEAAPSSAALLQLALQAEQLELCYHHIEAAPAAERPSSSCRRRVLEEDSLMAALQRHTPRLTVVHSLGDLPVRQQAELVCSHELVIGPHGAGFTHLLFRQEGPNRAVELMAEGNGSLTFALLSGRLGIEHAIAIGEAITTDNGPNYPDLRIAPEAVVELAWAGIGTA